MVSKDTENNTLSTNEFTNKDNKIKSRVKKNKNLFKISELFSLIIITMIVSLTLGYFLGQRMNGTTKLSDEMKKFINDYNEIKENYYEDINDKEILKKALESVVNSLGDPYSTVIDNSLSNSINTELKGQYSGFGIQIANTKDNRILIVSIIDDSPALEAGLKAGDIILKMDGESVEGKTTDEFTKLVKGSNKQTIILTLLRDNKEIDIAVTRKIVTLKSVSSKIFEQDGKKVGYIYISIFAANTDSQFKKELIDLEKKGINSLIIDVRDNTGGHLTSVENIISMFLDKKHVIYQIESKGKTTKTYSKNNDSKKYKVVMLVNENSASASEMLTAAMKEEYNSEVVGMKTFGKGTVQEVGNTSNTNLNYKITTKKWLTPKGNWINKKGIEPTIKVELSKEYIKNPSEETDNQLKTAIETAIK
ncbi:MAG: S41 family peptidase [Tenericutes bacterium]|nr:S41 family peptidase [Mycoplasmatota bacterium]MDY3802041.1 S41 family peptidase [Bacilli bacterium]